jgi:hypothetical protein
MGMLSLTFVGPFVFVVPTAKGGSPSSTVNIYAPKCQGHLGAVYYGDGSYPLSGRFRTGGSHQYTVGGVDANTGNISFQWNSALFSTSPILSPESQTPKTPYTPNFSDAYFCITAPRPKIYYALNIVNDTEVVTSGEPAGNFSNWSTAFRLYYDWDLKKPISLQPPKYGSVAPPAYYLTPPAGGPPATPPGWSSLGETGDVEFRLDSPSLTDPDHQDASACFDQMVQLAGLSWWLNFDTGTGGGGAQFHNGSDCLALSLVVGLNN